MSAPVFITHEVFREPAWGTLHPLSIERQGAVLDVCAALGWLPPGALRHCNTASFELLTVFHSEAYVAAFREASRVGFASLETRRRYNFGTMENPLFPGVYERAAATVGGAVCAAYEAMNTGCAFHPAGGTHHGQKERAHGFCYFNDPVFAILTLLAADVAPVLYVDIDAHHGDGVEAAFSGDRRVFLASIHESGRWPRTGETKVPGCGNVRNFPVPARLNDTEFSYLIDRPISSIAERLRPRAIVIVAGADCLGGDPLSTMEVSNLAFWAGVERLCALAPIRVVLGGGGYNPWTTVRAWAGLWGRLAGYDLPDEFPQKASEILSSLSCDLIDADECDPMWTRSLSDAPNCGLLRPEVAALAALAEASFS